MKAFFMLMRREFWEHRSLWLAPLLVAALILLGIAVQDEWQNIARGAAAAGAGTRPPAVFGVLNLEALFFVTSGIVAAAYLMDCLYAERRDRSILFWRSLPVSDSATVLAKFTVATVAVPMLFYVAAVVTSAMALQWIKPRDPGAVVAWGEWLQLQGVLLYATVATVLWYAPYAAYLMLVSAWARRSVLAWALTPPLLVALIERVVFGTTYVGRVVQRGFNELYRLAFRINQQVNVTLGDVLQPMRGDRGGGPGGGRGPRPGPDLHFDPTELLGSPQLWLGLALAVLLLWAAIRLRQRDRDA